MTHCLLRRRRCGAVDGSDGAATVRGCPFGERTVRPSGAARSRPSVLFQGRNEASVKNLLLILTVVLTACDADVVLSPVTHVHHNIKVRSLLA